MPVALLKTKLHVPKAGSDIVDRPRLLHMMDTGTQRKLTLVSAGAGYGKTTLLGEWIEHSRPQVAWLSLDRGDSDPVRFLSYLILALQVIEEGVGEGLLAVLQSSQPPASEAVMTPLLNEISAIGDEFVLVLDDYHAVESETIDRIMQFLLEHLPGQMHLIITTREDPCLPLARLRARDQLTEIRASDLQFTDDEAFAFLNQVMGITVSGEDVSKLGNRTEGWITGLRLAAISMRGRDDVSDFVHSFSGSHRYVLDYLMGEVLQQQSVQDVAFLLETSILDRLCGSLCDAILLSDPGTGQKTLENLELNNMFLIPLDDERHWFRYHHLFADLLRQRLKHRSSLSSETAGVTATEQLHIRASEWFAQNGLEIEALEHAAAAGDLERAEHLIESGDVPMYFRGAAHQVLKWLDELSPEQLDATPSLWVIHASSLLLVGQHTAVEQKLLAAEEALRRSDCDRGTSDLEGRIACIRATLAVIQSDAGTIVAQSRRARGLLAAGNRIFRTIASWSSGFAHQLSGDRDAASNAYEEAISIGCESLYTAAATITLGMIQESNNRLNLAESTYNSGIRLTGNPPHTIACEAFLGLARIHYEWNDLEAAQEYGLQSLELTRYTEHIDSPASYKVFLARVMRAEGDWTGAESLLDEAEEYVRRNHFEFRLPTVAEVRTLVLLHRDDPAAARELASRHDLALSLARVHLHQGNTSDAIAILNSHRSQAEARGWHDEILKATILQALAQAASGNKDQAVARLVEALNLVREERFVRTFVDEGPAMANLLSEAHGRAIDSSATERLLAAFRLEKSRGSSNAAGGSLPELLSERELEVLSLIAAGLKNKEIGEKLFISLNTVLYHTKNIYGKLGVSKRTQAIARAREIKLI